MFISHQQAKYRSLQALIFCALNIFSNFALEFLFVYFFIHHICLDIHRIWTHQLIQLYKLAKYFISIFFYVCYSTLLSLFFNVDITIFL